MSDTSRGPGIVLIRLLDHGQAHHGGRHHQQGCTAFTVVLAARHRNDKDEREYRASERDEYEAAPG